MKRKHKIILILALMSIVVAVFVVSEAIYAYNSHKTLQSYASFRGCTVINQTSTYAYCSTGEDRILKLVKYDGRWYLGGDLPCGFLCDLF